MSSPVYGLFSSEVVALGQRPAAGVVGGWWPGDDLGTQLNKWIQQTKERNARGSISPYHMRQAKEEHTGDAWLVRAEEGRGTLRKASVSRVQARKPTMSEWGNPAWFAPGHVP